MALTATAGLLGSQLIVGIISLYDPTYELQPWHQFLLYLGYTLIMALINAFGNSLLPYINKAAISWSFAGFVIISITVLACGSGDYNSADFVFTNFQNVTGWPDGIAWLLGLLQGTLSLTGFDATAHMVEEIPNAAIEAPKILIYCVLIGMFTGFIFLMCLLFVAGDVDKVINSSAGPLGYIFYNATGSKAGTVCLLIFPLVCLLFAGISIMTTSSRMTYAFARDGGLPFSRFFRRVHPKLDGTYLLELKCLPVDIVLIMFNEISPSRGSRPDDSCRRDLWLHLPRIDKRLQCHHLCLRCCTRTHVRDTCPHQRSPRTQDASTQQSIQDARAVGMVCEPSRHCIRYLDHRAICFPARAASDWIQHELLHCGIRRCRDNQRNTGERGGAMKLHWTEG